MLRMGDVREDLGWKLMNKVEELVNKLSEIRDPYWIVFHAKPDKFSHGKINATIQHYFQEPPKNILGLLVWYVDNSIGKFELLSDFSSPPDVPLDPSVLSDKKEDFSVDVAKRGEKLKVLSS